jgi:hypothetical protein
MIKGFCFISDERFYRMGQWCKSSFEATNPYEMVLVNLEESKQYEFYKWHHETKEHPLRVRNLYGMMKFIAAREIMEVQNLDRLIVLGADVFTVGSFKGIEHMEYEVLHSLDLGRCAGIPLNPDVVVVTKSFVTKIVDLYLEQFEAVTLDPCIYEYQEMYMLNHLVNIGAVSHMSLAESFGVSEYCFNMNVRTGIRFDYNQQLQRVEYGGYPATTIHIQTGLGGCDAAALDHKLFNCIRTSPAFSDEQVRDYITKITGDTGIWN